MRKGWVVLSVRWRANIKSASWMCVYLGIHQSKQSLLLTQAQKWPVQAASCRRTPPHQMSPLGSSPHGMSLHGTSPHRTSPHGMSPSNNIPSWKVSSRKVFSWNVKRPPQESSQTECPLRDRSLPERPCIRETSHHGKSPHGMCSHRTSPYEP